MTAHLDEVEAESLHGEFAAAVIDGFSAPTKHIPCRFLYDARGSELFEDITRLDEYYPTRTEIGLLQEHGPEIATLAGKGCAVVEFGSGSSRKTHILLDHLDDAAAYIPIDISDDALSEAAGRISARYPDLAVHPLHADFSQGIALPAQYDDAPRLGFFPGSTIGNFELEAAEGFLTDAGDLLGPGSDLLIGADLKKDSDVLLAAYDDGKGVTADFTLNLIHRINRELGGNLDIGAFEHAALYNEERGRIEIYIVSCADQEIEIDGQHFSLSRGERIHVENSHKYTVPQFQDLAKAAGWRSEKVWTDDRDYFSLHYLRRGADGE